MYVCAHSAFNGTETNSNKFGVKIVIILIKICVLKQQAQPKCLKYFESEQGVINKVMVSIYIHTYIFFLFR